MEDKHEKTVQATVALVLLAVGLGIAYVIWPSGITDQSLGSMTFGNLLRAIASGAIGLVAIYLVALVGIDWD
jgi:hypothetical protein